MSLRGTSATAVLGRRFVGFLAAVMLLTPAPPAQAQTFPLSAVPQLSSNPSASNKIYLNFVGDNVPWWGQGMPGPGVVPAYNMDDDPMTFNAMELNDIRVMYACAAEAYSPFNVDVTTINPGESHFTTPRDCVKVVVGGDDTWLHMDPRPGGVATISGFRDGDATCFVFPGRVADILRLHPELETPRHPVRVVSLVKTIAHEVGHEFGLPHQHSFDPYWYPGQWDDPPNYLEYGLGTWRWSDDGTRLEVLKVPIMGQGGGLLRSIWGVATTDYPPSQDDVAQIASDENGFGYRPDDHGNTMGTAGPLTILDNWVSGAGIIETLADKDFFSFTTPGGFATITVSPTGQWTYVNPTDGYPSKTTWIGMLDVKAELFDADNNLLASGDHAYSWDWLDPTETISIDLLAGTYYLAVESQGVYGDLGQYEITGMLTPEPATLSLLALGGLMALRRRR